MLLDAPTFKTVLTPESALGIIQKTLASKGYKEYEVSDIRLVYTPYYYFSFDVIAQQGQSPSGKTALNAYTGDLNDFIPYLMERPLKKIRAAEEKAEVEPTAVSEKEVKDVCAGKLAAQVGLKKENISIGALSKIYVPTFRIWVQVAGDERKVEVDALVGAPTGLEDLPEKAKTWGDSLKDVLEKMKTPQGWLDLFKGLGSVLKAPGSSPLARYGLLALVILVLLFFIGRNQGLLAGGVNIVCNLDDEFLGPVAFLGLGERSVVPGLGSNRSFYVRGTCFFENKGNKPVTLAVARVMLKRGEQILALESPAVRDIPVSQVPSEKRFTLTWREAQLQPVRFVYEKGI